MKIVLILLKITSFSPDQPWPIAAWHFHLGEEVHQLYCIKHKPLTLQEQSLAGREHSSYVASDRQWTVHTWALTHAANKQTHTQTCPHYSTAPLTVTHVRLSFSTHRHPLNGALGLGRYPFYPHTSLALISRGTRHLFPRTRQRASHPLRCCPRKLHLHHSSGK